MIRLRFAIPGLALIGFGAFLLLTQPRMAPLDDLQGLTASAQDGEAVFWAAGCASCHMAPDAKGADQLVLAGGRPFASPFGTFIAPNISTDTVHGIGGWTLITFADALRSGISSEGQHIFPALPYNAYNKMTGQDLVNLKAYMDGLPAAATPSQPHQVGFPFNIRRSLGIWKLLFVSDTYVIEGDLTPQQSRGRYLAEALAHCGECHTPRNVLGGLDRSRWLGGAADPSGKGRIPNITPGKLDWSEAEIVTYLTTGFTPDYDAVGGHMTAVVDNMGHLPQADVQAIAAYLKAVPPVE
jgi:mono/diheme cytochrome c family protein